MGTKVLKNARSILRDHAAITLSAEGQLQLAKLLQVPLEPTEAMKRLRQQPRLKVCVESPMFK